MKKWDKKVARWGCSISMALCLIGSVSIKAGESTDATGVAPVVPLPEPLVQDDVMVHADPEWTRDLGEDWFRRPGEMTRLPRVSVSLNQGGVSIEVEQTDLCSERRSVLFDHNLAAGLRGYLDGEERKAQARAYKERSKEMELVEAQTATVLESHREKVRMDSFVQGQMAAVEELIDLEAELNRLGMKWARLDWLQNVHRYRMKGGADQSQPFWSPEKHQERLSERLQGFLGVAEVDGDTVRLSWFPGKSYQCNPRPWPGLVVSPLFGTKTEFQRMAKSLDWAVDMPIPGCIPVIDDAEVVWICASDRHAVGFEETSLSMASAQERLEMVIQPGSGLPETDAQGKVELPLRPPLSAIWWSYQGKPMQVALGEVSREDGGWDWSWKATSSIPRDSYRDYLPLAQLTVLEGMEEIIDEVLGNLNRGSLQTSFPEGTFGVDQVVGGIVFSLGGLKPADEVVEQRAEQLRQKCQEAQLAAEELVAKRTEQDREQRTRIEPVSHISGRLKELLRAQARARAEGRQATGSQLYLSVEQEVKDELQRIDAQVGQSALHLALETYCESRYPTSFTSCWGNAAFCSDDPCYPNGCSISVEDCMSGLALLH